MDQGVSSPALSTWLLKTAVNEDENLIIFLKKMTLLDVIQGVSTR
jgi:hypothetical protein